MKLILLLSALLALSSAIPKIGQIKSFPGFAGTLPFEAYSGYFPVNDGKKFLFFMFALSQGNPETDPVVLWLNGGPGCSSFDGFIYEHGPFTFLDGPMGAQQNLTLNPYSWNKVANVIYLDSPAGVGLSFSQDPGTDYKTGDTITAKDSHNFLLNFFSHFVSYQKNDFYVAGESYGGVYVPTLSQQVLLGNQQGLSPKINMKGYMVGNGVTDQVFDGNAWVPFVIGHALIGDDLIDQVNKACPTKEYWNATGECQSVQFKMSELTGGLNIYNIYEDCYQSGFKAKGPISKLEYRMQQIRDSKILKGEVPCIDSSRAHAYLNQDSVRTAFHAIPVSQQEWTICSNQIDYRREVSSTIPIHKQLLAAGYRGLVYSGDTDMCVPYTGSEAWTKSLGFSVTSPWRPWTVSKQVAGYVVSYKGSGGEDLTYCTIKGSGHTVPQYKPPQAFHFFEKFLANESF